MPQDLTLITWLIFAPLAGLLVGSFLNVCVYRLPKNETIVKGHSYCPSCRHILSAADLVPVFSYLFLKRRCRYCRSKISARYAVVEAAVGIYFFLAAYSWQSIVTSPDLSQNLPVLMPGISSSLTYTLAVAADLVLFCGLGVWALILWDKKNPPSGLFVFCAGSVFTFFLLSPLATAISLLAGIICAGLVYLTSLMTYSRSSASKNAGQGYAGLVFMIHFGLPALIWISTFYIILPLILKITPPAATNILMRHRNKLPVFSLAFASLTAILLRLF